MVLSMLLALIPTGIRKGAYIEDNSMIYEQKLAVAVDIPSDILRIVFMLLWDSKLSMRQSLSSVCRSWRITMFSIGRYWTKIKVQHRRFGDTTEYMNEYIIQLAIRSGTQPLDIEWNIDTVYVKAPPIFDKFLQIAPISRWKSLQIREPMGLPFEALSCGFSVLESVEIHYPMIYISSLLLAAIDKSALGIVSLTATEPWSQVSAIFPNAVGRITSVRLLHHAAKFPTALPPNIVSLEMPNAESRQKNPFYQIKSLTTLHPFNAPGNFPNLETLTLITSTYASSLMRSSPTFEKLHTLNIIGFTHNIIQRYPAPNLQHLSCDVCADPSCRKAADPDTIRFTLSSKDPYEDPPKPRFPKLRTLTLRVNCAHSNTSEQWERDVDALKKCAREIFVARRENHMQYIEFVWEDADSTIRYDYGLALDS